MSKDGFAQKLMEVCAISGTIQSADLVTICSVYDDDKIRIVGYLIPPSDPEEGWRFTRFHITLKTPPPPQEQQPRFGLETRHIPEETVVYHGDVKRSTKVIWLYDHFYRPGKWELYVEQLANGIQKRRESSRRLDKTPANDDHLFPEIVPEAEPDEAAE